MSCSDLTERQGTRIVLPVIATRMTCPIIWLGTCVVALMIVAKATYSSFVGFFSAFHLNWSFPQYPNVSYFLLQYEWKLLYCLGYDIKFWKRSFWWWVWYSLQSNIMQNEFNKPDDNKKVVSGWQLLPTYIFLWYTVMSLTARFMGPTWGPSGADRTQVGPMLDPWTLLSGVLTSKETCLQFALDPGFYPYP